MSDPSAVAFSPEEGVEATKDFVGIIVDAEYGLNPLGFVGRGDIEQRPQLAIQISTETYEKPQYEWYAPSNVKLTKWLYFIEGLNKSGALKETNSSGATVAERMTNFAKSLVGMKFRWLEHRNLEAVATPIRALLVPEEYLGREEVQKPTEIETEEVVL